MLAATRYKVSPAASWAYPAVVLKTARAFGICSTVRVT
jgi:hypothetical protein